MNEKRIKYYDQGELAGTGILLKIIPGDEDNYSWAVIQKEDGFLMEIALTDVQIINDLWSEGH